MTIACPSSLPSLLHPPTIIDDLVWQWLLKAAGIICGAAFVAFLLITGLVVLAARAVGRASAPQPKSAESFTAVEPPAAAQVSAA